MANKNKDDAVVESSFDDIPDPGLSEEPDASEQPDKKEKANKKPPKEKMVKIKLPLTKELKNDLFVSVNNRRFLIKRGREVEVPECVAEQIRHSENMAAESVAYMMELEEKFESKSKEI